MEKAELVSIGRSESKMERPVVYVYVAETELSPDGGSVLSRQRCE